MSFSHATVMLSETVDAVAPRAGGVYADVTLGGGGHAEGVLERSAPDGVLIGIDRDPAALDAARQRLGRFGARARLVHARMSELLAVVQDQGVGSLDGVIADLGVSSPQLDVAERGFSFAQDGPLDMRMDTTRGESARELIEGLDENELANVIYEFGEERLSRRIARVIKTAEREGALSTTSELRRAVHRAVGGRRGRIDPATRTFQALRIAVNRELGELDDLLGALPATLKEGGVAAIISFHSLEDRRVKLCFRGDARWSPLTKKPVIASEAEQAENPRARSAKLRAARWMGDAAGEGEAA